MADPGEFRRPTFRAGRSVRLADGQPWDLPPHPDTSEIEAGPFADAYLDLLRGLATAEDRHERLRFELALAIFLLDLNYELAPAGWCALLEFPEGSPRLHAAQSVFHEVAQAHLRLLPAPADVETLPAPGLSTLLTRFVRTLASLGRLPGAGRLESPATSR